MHLVGPVFYYDLIRSARRGRLFLVRIVYVLFLLIALGLMLLSVEARLHAVGSGGVPAKFLTELAEAFFGAFMGLQFAAVLIVTPSLVAGAVTEEKQRQTLDFLFTTDLLNREVILGKFSSRLGSGILFLAAGYPVLCLVQLFGGVDPTLLLGGFAVTFVTMISIACLGLYFSVRARRVREALLKTYLAMLAYLAGWGVLAIVRAMMLLDWKPTDPVVEFMDQVIDWYNVGNPGFLIYYLGLHMQGRGALGMSNLLVQATCYAGFHIAVAVFFLWRSIRVVRKVYIRQTYDPKPKKRLKGWMAIPVGAAFKKVLRPTKPLERNPAKSLRRKPPMGISPMRWKERYVEKGLRFGALTQTIYVMLMFALLSVGVVMVGVLFVSLYVGTDTDQFGWSYNRYFRVLAMVVTLMMLASIGLRSAGSIGSEKDRQTWDGLLASPLRIREIIFAKGEGAIWGARLYIGILFTFAVLGAIGQGLSLSGGLLTLCTVMAIAYFTAGLGLYCAARCRNSMQAIVLVLFLLIVINMAPSGVQFLLWNVDHLLGGTLLGVDPSRYRYTETDWFSALAFFSPLQAMFYVPTHPEQSLLSFYPGPDRPEWSASALTRASMFAMAMVFYFLCGRLFWELAFRRLNRTCGRIDGQKARRTAARALRSEKSTGLQAIAAAIPRPVASHPES